MSDPNTAATNAGDLMPAVFVGHGTPMNAIEENAFSLHWQELGRSLPVPQAVLCISAHWETHGSWVTAMETPRTIHDFGGFPQELFQVQYPAPGSLWLAEKVRGIVRNTQVHADQEWGLDHGTWSVLKHLYPKADIPVVQLSLDFTRSPREHYAIGQELLALRRQGILVLGSGNMVHNLGMMMLDVDHPDDFNYPFGFDWAVEANALLRQLIREDRHGELCDYARLGKSVRLAVPTPEHFLPMLYILALKQASESITYFNDQPVAGSLTMTSFTVSARASERLF